MTSSPPSDSEGESSSFERLHPKVQRWIWQRGWRELRPVQDEALPPILAGRDVLLAAPTAGGKTEAAFLPIASSLAKTPAAGLGCLCISPLKALINDQHRRLSDLFDAVDVPVHAWHGDVSASRKRRVLDGRPGVLLITPESLEALFVRRGPRMPSLWAALQFVVVDELHAFIGSERGRQLQSLLHRVDDARGMSVPRIGLSATLGKMEMAQEFLRPGCGHDVVPIVDRDDHGGLSVQLRGYVQTPPKLDGKKLQNAERAGIRVEPEDVTEGGTLEIAEHIFTTLRGDHHLIFANSRRLVEQLADILRRRCETEALPLEFFPHHGSLAREFREVAESKLKDKTQPTTVIATTTLELGIDVGDIKSVAQVGVPPSVASLRQRLGRSGRRNDSSAVLRLYAAEQELKPNSPVRDMLRVDLVQSTAMLELLIREQFCETPDAKRLHLSTLVQQILSVVAGRGGVQARDTYQLLCETGPFSAVGRRQFLGLLRELGQRGLIDQTGDGDIVLGVRGEKLVDHYEFYAAFQTPEEYRLVTNEGNLGSLPISFPLYEGTLIIFAGSRWCVARVEEERKTLFLEPARGGVPPQFDGGGFEVDGRVRQEMRALYESADVPRYLNRGARELLEEGRSAYRRLSLDSKQILAQGNRVLLFPWASTRVTNTLRLYLASESIAAEDQGVALEADGTTAREVHGALGKLVSEPPDVSKLVSRVENLAQEKYDALLPLELAQANYARRFLDLEGAIQAAKEVIASEG